MNYKLINSFAFCSQVHKRLQAAVRVGLGVWVGKMILDSSMLHGKAFVVMDKLPSWIAASLF